MKAQTFLCEGSAESKCYDRYLDEEDTLQVHRLVGGGTLWECHGSPEGDLFTGGREINFHREDVFVACYPSQVGEKQGLRMALPNHEGVVMVRYEDLGLRGLYLLVVEAE